MIGKGEVEGLLKHWADEFGGGRYEWLGYASSNILQRLADHKGFVPSSGGYKKPPIRTQAHDVDDIVTEMLSGDWWQAAHVLRAEYFMPNAAFEAKRDALAKPPILVKVGRTRYYDLLELAKGYVASGINARKNSDIRKTA